MTPLVPAALAPEAAAALAPERRWIVSRRYDIAWFFGGLAVSALAAVAVIGAGASMAAVYWIFLLAFDGPHIAAAFTRTYLDREEWRTRPRVLVGSLVLAFGLGPLALALDVARGGRDAFTLYLGFAALYGVYHVVRQHYGFLALYKSAARDASRLDFAIDRWALYVGCFAPYVAFMLSHPRARRLIPLPETPALEAVERAVVALAVTAFVASLAVPLARALRRFGPGALARPQVAYLLLVNALYGVTFLAVARLEPLYAASRGPDEDFLLLGVVTVVFHDIQYVALVWFHNRNRYGGASARETYGAAAGLNASVVRYLGACALFSGAIYLTSACSTGVFPHCTIFAGRTLGPVTANEVGLSLWWGLGLHHYFLDQRIWRVRGDAALRKNLGLEAS